MSVNPGAGKSSSSGASSARSSAESYKVDGKVDTTSSQQGQSIKREIPKKTLMKLINNLIHCDTKTISWNKAMLVSILDRVKDTLLEQDTMVRVRAPIKIVGDIHGQYSDLKRIFKANGYLPENRYLFLGDYVDRGNNSLETIMLLFCYKALYPESIVLLRGNHECMNINRVYGFYDELQRRSLLDCYPEFNDVFDHLPITALINSSILCMHGGISKHLTSMKQLKTLSRPVSMIAPDAPDIATDLLWADPETKHMGYKESARGISNTFGMDVLEEFCKLMDIDLVVRAHQVCARGFERMGFNKTRLVTVFSAPNYCNEFDNSAAVMYVSDKMSVHFNVLEPSADPMCIAERESTRTKVPVYDEFPHLDIQQTTSISKASKSFKKNVQTMYHPVDKKKH